MAAPSPLPASPGEPNAEPTVEPGGELDEMTLVRAQRGESSACVALVRRYEGRVCALLGRMLGPRGLGDLVDDVAQEAFLRVFRALPGFERDGPARLSTWIITVTSRLAINELKRRRLTGDAGPESLPGQATADGGLERTELRARLHRAIGTLTPEQQAAFVLRQFHGLDDAAIAAALDLEVGAVKSRLFRARARLRAALTEDSHG